MIAEPSYTMESLSSYLDGKTEVDALRALADLYPGKVVFSTSLGYEDQVITDLICKHNIPIRIFTLDTGRLFPETYSVWEKDQRPLRYPDRNLLSESGSYGKAGD